MLVLFNTLLPKVSDDGALFFVLWKLYIYNSFMRRIKINDIKHVPKIW